MTQAIRRARPAAAAAGVVILICLLLFGVGRATPSGAATSAASNDPDLTNLPLGDGRTTTTSPQPGYLFQCRTPMGGGGAAHSGPWIHGSTYDLTAKFHVDGSVDWPSAFFKKKIKGKRLKLTGNGLPTDHTTGVYPIQPSDDAFQVDRNPNSIQAQSIALNLPNKPKRLATPGCVGGEVGIATNGVAIFNAVDAANRDAVAHEVQDNCAGHPEVTGVYHYHGLPPCVGSGKSNEHSKVIGWALDGFPIYGPRGKKGRYLSNADLDECHGITERLKYQGEKRKLFHYVANYEYPYTVGCFRGIPTTLVVAG